MKKTKIYITATLLFGFALMWHACTQKNYINETGLFEKTDDLSFFKSANGKFARVDYLNKTIDRFKILDQSQHFADRLQSWYGEARWDMTMVVNNNEGLFTLITPFVNTNDSVTAMLFAYYADGGAKTIYKLYNKENYKKYFSYAGDKDAKTINRSTIEGWFNLFSKTNQKLKGVKEGKTLSRTIYYEWECIRYTWTYGDATDGSSGLGMSDWQCTMTINDDGNHGGHQGEPESTLENGACGGQPCNDGGGGTVETWTFIEKPSDPCAEAKRRDSIASALLKNPTIKRSLDSLIATVATDTKEKSYSFGIDTNGNYVITPITIGVSQRAPLLAFSPSFTVLGGVHTHTASLYNAFSVGDLYSFYEGFAKNKNFRNMVVASSNGDKYLLSITDSARFSRFVSAYSKDANLDTKTNGWIQNTEIGDEFRYAFNDLQKQGLSEDEAFKDAWAYVINEYKMGVSLSKADTNGDFKGVFVSTQEGTLATAPLLIVPTNTCNLK